MLLPRHLRRPMSMLRAVAFILATSAASAAPIDNWNRFEFSCVHEDLNTPTPSPEAEAVFQRAGQLKHQAFSQGDSELLLELLREYARLTLQAAEMGHVQAMNNLVPIYTHAYGFPNDPAKAAEWAEKLMAMNKGVGYYHMGAMLQHSASDRGNPETALAYLRRSADLGNSEGQYETGIKMLEAFAQSPDKTAGQAIGAAMLQCALDQNLAQAGYELGLHYVLTLEDDKKALRVFQQTGKLGHKESLYALHSVFKNGNSGVAKDPQRAACYGGLYKKASRSHPTPIPDLDDICPLPPKPMPRRR